MKYVEQNDIIETVNIERQVVSITNNVNLIRRLNIKACYTTFRQAKIPYSRANLKGCSGPGNGSYFWYRE